MSQVSECLTADARLRVEAAERYLEAALIGRVSPEEGIDAAMTLLGSARRFQCGEMAAEVV